MPADPVRQFAPPSPTDSAGRAASSRPGSSEHSTPFEPHWMSSGLDMLSLKFVLFAQRAKAPVLDVGCGAGSASISVLQRGGRVVAVDPQSEFLEALRARVRRGQHARLELRVGALPLVDFPAETFAAIHAGHVLQLLRGPELELSLQRMRRWIRSDGQLFLSVSSPEGPAWQFFAAEYARRKTSGVKWPGFIDDVARSARPAGKADRRGFIHLLDADLLTGALDAAGFEALETTTFLAAAAPFDGASCAVIARPR